MSNNVDDDNELCEKSLSVDTPESSESSLIDEIVSNDGIYVSRGNVLRKRTEGNGELTSSSVSRKYCDV